MLFGTSVADNPEVPMQTFGNIWWREVTSGAERAWIDGNDDVVPPSWREVNPEAALFCIRNLPSSGLVSFERPLMM